MRITYFALLFLFAAAAPCVGVAAGTDGLLQRARDLVAAEALTPPPPEAAESALLKGYLRSVDVYSTYLSPAEVHRMGQQKKDGFVGVGMDVLQDAAGTIYCLPFPQGPAERAGVRHGDVLHSVDGTPVSVLPFMLLESVVRGDKETSVRFGLTGEEGARTLTVRRDVVNIPHVAADGDGPFPRVRIFRFTSGTPTALREAVTQLGTPRRLVLDLRGNPGGDMDAALACAAFFLGRGTVMSVQRTRTNEEKVHKAGGDAIFSMPLALWQDKFTASAAEVFIAALADNGRGKILGQRSFGKGVSQRARGAGNGGLFILTTAQLLRPDRTPYHGIGLEPDLLVSKSAHPERDYFRRSYEVFGLRP